MSDRISEADVRHVARLARLNLDDEHVTTMTRQLDHVLDYIAKLEELDVTDVEPMAHAGDVTDALRDDEPVPGLSPEQALHNAPASDPPFFKVPKVLGDGPGA